MSLTLFVLRPLSSSFHLALDAERGGLQRILEERRGADARARHAGAHVDHEQRQAARRHGRACTEEKKRKNLRD